jgi:hypothetical protein
MLQGAPPGQFFRQPRCRSLALNLSVSSCLNRIRFVASDSEPKTVSSSFNTRTPRNHAECGSPGVQVTIAIWFYFCLAWEIAKLFDRLFSIRATVTKSRRESMYVGRNPLFNRNIVGGTL